MTTNYIPPASLEAQKVQAKCRKIIPQKPRREKRLSCDVFPFKFDLNSEACIEEELEPKKAIICDLSLLNKGDKIIGVSISGFSTSAKPVKKPKVKKGSSTHQANFISFKGFVYARLEKPFQSLERMEKPKISG